jgi:RHS repeat-associated protein
LHKTTEVNPLGHTVQYEYDARGNLAKVVMPDGASFTCQYSHFNQPQRATDSLGSEWLWHYDEFGQLEKSVNPLGEVYKYEYKAGLLSARICPLGTREEFKYDDSRNLARVRLPNGAETGYQYDRLGRLTAQRDAYGHVQKHQYDATGNLVRVEEPDGNVRSFEYDAEGNIILATDSTRRVILGYSGFHHLAFREEAGSRTCYRYDTEGQLFQIENELAEKCLFERDGNGLVVEECGFEGRRRRYKRDAAGQAIGIQRGDGTSTTLEYDPCGRLIQRSYSDGSMERFGYRADGALIEAINDAATVRFERDAAGRILREFQGEHWVESRYNSRGERVWMESSGGAQVDFIRNGLGAASAVVWNRKPTPWRVELERDLMGRNVGRRLPGGVTEHWTRDPLGRPLSHSVTHRGNLLENLSYKWEGPKLNFLRSSTRGTTRYEHDARGRLSAARHSDGQVEYRTPTVTGSVHHRPDQSKRSHGPGGRIETLEGIHFIYDAEGNAVEKQLPDGRSWKYRYAANGMLSEVIRPDGRQLIFQYDAFCRRVRKTHSEGEVQWLWDGHTPLHETRETGECTTWLFEPESFSLLGKVDDEKRCYGAVSDHLGSATALYDEAGQVAWSMQLDLAGKPRTDAAEVSSPWRWPGQYEDAETGLYYNRFRYYDPESGCYTSADPLGFLAGTNSYLYTDDPTALIDPLGLNQIVPTDLFATGNASGPRPPRIEGYNLKPGQKSDLSPGSDGLLRPADPPKGASTFADPSQSSIFENNHHHKLPKGTVLPEGIGVIADGKDVNPRSPHGKTHHTIFPTRAMSPEEFAEKLKNLPWQPMGKYKKTCK